MNRHYVFVLISIVLCSLLFSVASAEGQSVESAVQDLTQRIMRLEQRDTKIPQLFTETLQIGSTGDQVKLLQAYLAQYPDIYPEGLITGYFGLLTEKALRRYQTKEGIAAVGIFGPITRAKVAARLRSTETNALGVANVRFPDTGTLADDLKGATGATGATGPAGPPGERVVFISGGTSGATGATGNTGATGVAGAVGTAGATGTQGVSGDIGLTGLSGITGATGTQGIAGTAGVAGATGAQGTIGVTGATGTTGVQGVAGTAGTAGVAGATGAQGTIGVTGAVGTTGLQGLTGTAGATGATGVTGDAGVAGATGATGATGASGTIIPTGIELGTTDAFARHQILNNMSNPILRLGTWQSDGDATSNVSQGIVDYGNSLTGLALSAGNGGYARIKSDRFGLFTIDTSTTGFGGAGGYYYRVDNSALFYKNNAAVDTFRVTRATGDMTVKGTVTLSNFTQAGVLGTNSSGFLSVLTGTTGQVPIWNNSTNGFQWANLPASTIPSAEYVQLGSQPASVGAGQPFTYTTTVLSTSGITPTTAVFNPPFTTSGTVFLLANVGRYEVNYQMTYPTDGGVVLYLGASVATMAPLPYTMIGKTTDSAVHGSVIIETTTPNSFVSVNAAAGNASAIVVPPNTSTTNQSATTVSFKQIN